MKVDEVQECRGRSRRQSGITTNFTPSPMASPRAVGVLPSNFLFLYLLCLLYLLYILYPLSATSHSTHAPCEKLMLDRLPLS